MAEFVCKRKSLPVRMMYGVDTDYRNPISDEDHSGQFFVERRETNYRSQMLTNFFQRDGNASDIEPCEKTSGLGSWAGLSVGCHNGPPFFWAASNSTPPTSWAICLLCSGFRPSGSGSWAESAGSSSVDSGRSSCGFRSRAAARA